MSLEHRSDPASFANPVATQADFTYSMTLNVIKIQDTGKGAKSVAEDLEADLRKIKYWHQGLDRRVPDQYDRSPPDKGI
jgi:hypothetical protein